MGEGTIKLKACIWCETFHAHADPCDQGNLRAFNEGLSDKIDKLQEELDRHKELLRVQCNTSQDLRPLLAKKDEALKQSYCTQSVDIGVLCRPNQPSACPRCKALAEMEIKTGQNTALVSGQLSSHESDKPLSDWDRLHPNGNTCGSEWCRCQQ